MDTRTTTRHLQKQSGSSLPGFILCFALLGLATITASRLIPVYIDHFKIRGSLHELSQDGDILNRDISEMLDFLQQNWSHNKVDIPVSDCVHIEKLQNQLKVDVHYDVVRPILGNVDAVIHFNDTVLMAAK